MNNCGLNPPSKGKGCEISIRFSGQIRRINAHISNCDNSPMEINQQCVVALTWTLKDTLGEVLDVLTEPVEFLVGGDDLFQTVEDALQGHATGAKLELQVEPG